MDRMEYWKLKAQELERQLKQLRRIITELTANDREPLPFTNEVNNGQ